MKLTEADLIAEKDIQKRRKMFLDDTVAFYNRNNRAVIQDEGLNPECIYSPTDKSPGCAIGRWAPALHGKSGIVTDSIDPFEDSPTLASLCPNWMQEMRSDFLREVQAVHDSEEFWNDSGLSLTGSLAVQKLKRKFNLP